jgi:hypothetical protein
MTLDLRSADINGAKYESNVPPLSCEPCILAKLHHAPVNAQVGTKATALLAFMHLVMTSSAHSRRPGRGEPNTYLV